MNRAAASLVAVILVIIMGTQGLGPLTAQTIANSESATEAREALSIARQQQRSARRRAEQLEAQGEAAEEASAKALADAAALAARVQLAEANVSGAEAELALVERERRSLERDLALRREPLARLTGALETMARRPLALAALQPGSLRDIVHTRAVLGSAIPIVRQRTAALRGDLERAESLEAERRQFVADRREAEQVLVERRRNMVALAEEQRVMAEQASGGANREAERAMELAEQTRDLDALVARLEVSATIRQRLASLDGPIARPSQPGSAALPSRSSTNASAQGSLNNYILPVAGRVMAGFGEATSSGGRNSGITISARPQAQIVAPSGGRVAFAGEYEGYGRIVILEHSGEWTSLVTGLRSLAVTTGQEVTAGSPLGLAASGEPAIGLELRRKGAPVNPLDQLR